MRLITKGMDARRSAQPMVAHWQAVQRRRRPFVFKPYGAVLLCAHCGVARRLCRSITEEHQKDGGCSSDVKRNHAPHGPLLVN